MGSYFVKIPFTGYVEVEVEADSEDGAIKKAFEVATLEDVVEWDFHKKVCEGNVFKGILNEVEVWED